MAIMHIVALLLLAQTLSLHAFASPVVSEDSSQQQVLYLPQPVNRPKYENGELPPTQDTIGWVDPRLNGGRFIDVCLSVAEMCKRLRLNRTTRTYRMKLITTALVQQG